jgi:dienelactone hydrolase
VAGSLLMAGSLLASCGGGSGGGSHPSAKSDATTPARSAAVAAPAGMQAPGAQWFSVDSSGGHRQLAAVLHPPQGGAAPLVVYLHGGDGLSNENLAWVARLAQAGYLVVAGCWSPSGTSPASLRCPQAPLSGGVDQLVAFAQTLADRRPGALAVVGGSAGARAALGVSAPDTKAVVADSPIGVSASGATVSPVPVAPVLLLHGTGDHIASDAAIRQYEAGLRAMGRPVETAYYEGADHVVTLQPGVGADATAVVLAFLKGHLG